MFNKRLLSICDSSKKWIGLTVLMNWISIICNIALILFIGTTVDKLINGNLNLNMMITSIFIMAMLGIRFVANFLSSKLYKYNIYIFYSSNSSRWCGTIRNILW